MNQNKKNMKHNHVTINRDFKHRVNDIKNNKPITGRIGYKVTLKNMTKPEILSLTRALINVRDGRDIEFLVPFPSDKVIKNARRVAKMPQKIREKEIDRVNTIALKV